jgi:predicted flavoprotein YhiN
MLMATPMSKPMPWCWPWAGPAGAPGLGWLVPLLQARQVEVAPLLPSNCGFELDWSEHFAGRFAGEPIKPVVASTALPSGGVQNRRGEFVITADGIEGSLVYAMSSALRDTITAEGSARLYLDLLPDWPLAVEAELAHPRGRVRSPATCKAACISRA